MTAIDLAIKHLIIEKIEQSEDAELLDLIYKLLLAESQ